MDFKMVMEDTLKKIIHHTNLINKTQGFIMRIWEPMTNKNNRDSVKTYT